MATRIWARSPTPPAIPASASASSSSSAKRIIRAFTGAPIGSHGGGNGELSSSDSDDDEHNPRASSGKLHHHHHLGGGGDDDEWVERPLKVRRESGRRRTGESMVKPTFQHQEEEEEERVEQGGNISGTRGLLRSADNEQQQQQVQEVQEGDDSVGPRPLKMEHSVNYGSNLLPGEGSAIAHYVQQNKRIPRRGEVGMASEVIEKFESIGYVMSGSRHALMNAVRIRKETQVITAEEKRLMALKHQEEKMKRENQLIVQFKNLVKKQPQDEVGAEGEASSTTRDNVL